MRSSLIDHDVSRLLLAALIGLAASCADDRDGVDAGPGMDSGPSTDAGPGVDGGPGADGGPGVDAGPGGDAGPVTCGARTCGADELCLTVPGCPSGPPPDPECIPVPPGCGDGPLSCGCFTADPCGGGCTTCGSVSGGQIACDCGCLCASPDTPIATPSGDRKIASLQVGDVVFSVHDEQIVAVPITRINRSAVSYHRVVRLRMADGRTIEMSPGHPTADGRSFGDLAAGDLLDGLPVARAELIPYEHPFTHDILPASDTGTYFAAGVLVGSTLAPQQHGERLALQR